MAACAYLLVGVLLVRFSERFDSPYANQDRALDGIMVLFWPFLLVYMLLVGVILGLGWLVGRDRR